MIDKNNKLIILTGPTAVGKTDLSIKLAKAVDGEIISADSAQVYKGLDIGSAKVTQEEMQGVKHYLIDMFEPDFPFDVTVFQKEAKKAVEEIYSRGRIPIVVGGTGFYIQALLYDISFDGPNSEDDSDREYRRSLEEYVEKTGDIDKLYSELCEVDPESAKIIHKNNIRRVIRALEFHHLHGIPISQHNMSERQKESVFDSRYYVLTMNRDRLYERINKRVDIMRKQGVLEEVKRLRDMGYGSGLTSMQAIGYKEIYEALDEIDSLKNEGVPFDEDDIIEKAFEKIKLNTRHFAKRQLTWFRREKDVIWLDKDTFSDDYRLSGDETDDRILETILKEI